MTGPTPKPAALRQRRNRTVIAAVLPADPGPLPAPPDLPRRGRRRRWHRLTIAWWHDVWDSPMASEFLRADIHGLYLLADLIDQYWREPAAQLAAEIRQQRQCFGLTPIDRRRLQWEVAKVENAPRRARPSGQKLDPRKLLALV